MNSFIKLPCSSVERLCVDKLCDLRLERTKRIKLAIDFRRKWIEQSFLRKPLDHLFKRTSPTDDEIKRYLQDEGGLAYIQVWFNDRARRIERIKDAACAVPEGEIYLSIDDYALIRDKAV